MSSYLPSYMVNSVSRMIARAGTLSLAARRSSRYSPGRQAREGGRSHIGQIPDGTAAIAGVNAGLTHSARMTLNRRENSGDHASVDDVRAPRRVDCLASLRYRA